MAYKDRLIGRRTAEADRGDRKPRRAEVRAAQIERANSMLGWLNDRLEAAKERRRLEEKSRLLAGPDGGGSGVTIEMRRLSAHFSSREPEWVIEHTGKNRAARRADRDRADRVWRDGRYVWPTPPGRNASYRSLAAPGGGDHA
jgi:hypothetical protein